MKVVLIGFMGSGKSSVAPRLAKKLGLAVVEMDDLVVKKAGGMSIERIFEAGGEAAFRELEIAVAKDLKGADGVVVSTGGGAVMNRLILDYLKDGAVVVELLAPFNTLIERISPKMPRPLFRDVPAAKRLYELRKPLYNEYATIHVSTANKSIDEVAQEVADKVKSL